MQRTFILVGAMLVLVGLLWPWLGKIPFGRLPGDIVIDRPEYKFYFPVTTTIVVSLALSLMLWLFRK